LGNGNPTQFHRQLEDELEDLDGRYFNNPIPYNGITYNGVLDAETIPQLPRGRAVIILPLPAYPNGPRDFRHRFTIVANRNGAPNTISQALVQYAFRNQRGTRQNRMLIQNHSQIGQQVEVRVHVTVTAQGNGNPTHISHNIVLNPNPLPGK